VNTPVVGICCAKQSFCANGGLSEGGQDARTTKQEESMKITTEKRANYSKSSTGALVIACLMLGLTACNRSPHLAATGWTQSALQMPAGIAASQLPAPENRGAQLTARYCSQCHGIPSPASHSASDWVPVMRRMMLRMERSAVMGQMMGRGMMGRGMPMGMMGAAVPTPSEERDILEYLQSHALRSIKEETLPEKNSSGAALYSRTCSRCHALPDPAQHTPEQWLAVVDRMRQYMRSGGVPHISDEQAQTIIEYLRRATRG